MKDDISAIKIFMTFLNGAISQADNTGELKGIEDAALEIFYKARQKRRSMETIQEPING